MKITDLMTVPAIFGLAVYTVITMFGAFGEGATIGGLNLPAWLMRPAISTLAALLLNYADPLTEFAKQLPFIKGIFGFRADVLARLDGIESEVIAIREKLELPK